MAVTDGLYVQVWELPKFYDVRRMLQLMSQTGIPATIAVFSQTPPVSGDDLTAYNLILQQAIGACSEIDSVCQQGKRYARADLEALATAALTSTDAGVVKRAAVLKQLAADLLYGNLAATRGQGADGIRSLVPRYEAAQATLEALYNGNRVFDLDANINAGVPKVAKIGVNTLNGQNFRPFFGYWPDDSIGTNPYTW